MEASVPLPPQRTFVPSVEPANEEAEALSRSSKSEDLEKRDIEKTTDFKTAVVEEQENDPFKVTWDGPDDPNNPLNWPSRKKGWTVASLSMITLITPLASSMFAPGVPEMMQDFHSTNDILGSFVVSVFLIGYVAGPLVAAPMGEYYGRTWVYNIANLLFVIFTIACAVPTSLNMLIGFRFLQGFAGSTPLVLGGGTIADLFIQEKRGGVMAIWAMGPLLGPVLGPIAGGFVAEDLGWRWVFWILAIFAGAVGLLMLTVVRETYAPIILQRKAAALRKSTGDDRYVSALKIEGSAIDLFKKASIRPMKMLVRSPIVLATALYIAVVYGYLYLLFTTITEVFEGQYNFGPGIVGLAYIGIGVGMFLGLLAFGITSDRMIKRAKAKGLEVKPEIRLYPMIPGALCIPIGLFWYGWSAQAHVHWIMPIIGTCFVGLGLIGSMMPVQTYLIDAYTVYAASALAANTILRSLVGAILPLAGRPLYAKLGLGWGNSLLAFIALAMAPLPLVFLKYGESLRTNKKFAPQW